MRTHGLPAGDSEPQQEHRNAHVETDSWNFIAGLSIFNEADPVRLRAS